MPAWIPPWLVKYLLNLAVSYGVPWLLTKLPWLPKDIGDVLSKLIDEIKESNSKDERKAAKARAHQKLMDRCTGVGCPIDPQST